MLPSKSCIEKLCHEFVEYDKEWEGSVIIHAIKNDKPICVFGVLNTVLGKKIRDEMIGWLTDNYSVIELYHNGKCYEYPSIKLAQKISIELGVPFTLYIHTKGAYNNNKFQTPVRDIWRIEFSTDRKNIYFKSIETDNPTVVAPFIGPEGQTWFNAFFCNRAAWFVKNVEKNSNRFWFEHIFRLEDNVKLTGVICKDISAHDVIIRVWKHRIKNMPK